MKLKYVALINIAGIVLSSFSPVFADTRTEKLKERERRLTEQAVMLSDKEINLEDKEKQLNRKQAELNDFAKKLQDEKIEFSVREIELDDTRAKLNRDSEFIAAQNREFQNEKAEFEGYRASVARQAEEAQRRLNEADERIKLAETRENKAADRERELSNQEASIAEELSEINIERGKLLTLREKTEESIKRLSDLEARENELKTAQKIFDEEKKKLESEKQSVAKLREEAENTMTEARAKMTEAEAKSRRAEAIDAKNQELEATITQLRENLRAKTDELDRLYHVNPGPKTAELPVHPDIPENASLTVTDNGIINWSDGSIRAKGQGVVPPDKNEAQGKLLARRAAVIDLQRNLLETVQGVQLDSKTTVEDAMTTSDKIATAVTGMIRGVEVVDEKFEEGIYTVWGQIRQDKMSGAMSEIVRRIRSTGKPVKTKQKTGQFTGLIIDATGLAGLQPRKLMRIVDEKGRPVYGAEFADRNIQASKGLCAYFDMIVFRENENDRVGSNPLKVKAQRLSNENADIVIPNWAADEIRNNAIDFLKECRVIVVKS